MTDDDQEMSPLISNSEAQCVCQLAVLVPWHIHRESGNEVKRQDMPVNQYISDSSGRVRNVGGCVRKSISRSRIYSPATAPMQC